MGSVGFEVGDESWPRTNGKKCKLPETIPENGGAVNHASVPRKLRSAIKKRRRKSVAPHLPILKKQRRASDGTEKLRNNGGKKSKPKMKQKQGHITKDEEEVAETLFALAGMFSVANKAKPPQLNDEPPENKSSATPEAGCLTNVIEAAKVIPSDDQAPTGEQVTAPRIECNINSPHADDKDGMITAIDSDASQPLSIENKVTAEKSCKRCLVHVYISRLIKDLKVRKESLLETPTPTPTYNQITGTSGTNGCVAFIGTTPLSVETENESAKVDNGIPLHNRGVEDQQLASETSAPCSAYEGYNFLSLGNGVGGLDHTVRLDTPNQFHEPYVHSQGRTAIFLSAQNGYSATFDGHNSTLAAHQVQHVPQHPASAVNSSFTSPRLGQPPVSRQQKWGVEVASQYTNATNGGRMSHLMLNQTNAHHHLQSALGYHHNYNDALFPHLQSALGYHQPLTLGQQMHQQQLMMGMNPMPLPVSNAMRNHLHLPLGLDRNIAAFYPETTPQHLQLPCNQHL